MKMLIYLSANSTNVEQAHFSLFCFIMSLLIFDNIQINQSITFLGITKFHIYLVYIFIFIFINFLSNTLDILHKSQFTYVVDIIHI